MTKIRPLLYSGERDDRRDEMTLQALRHYRRVLVEDEELLREILLEREGSTIH